MKRTHSLLFLSALLLVACKPVVPPSGDGSTTSSAPAMMQKDEDAMMKKDEGAMMDAQSQYMVYTDAVLMNGETKVLFFHAAWCPVCKVQDQALQEWYPSSEFSRSVYKVDYDTSADLKAKYGVVYQHTFVVVDGQGNMVSKVQGPTDEQLMALLQ